MNKYTVYSISDFLEMLKGEKSLNMYLTVEDGNMFNH